MDNVYADAFAEVIEVLKHSKQDIVNKIPDKFIQFLNENMNKNYNVNIDFNDEKWDESVKQETQAILALIYRDYIVSPKEREKLIAEEKEELIKQEQELSKQYSIDNLFKKKHSNEKEISNEDTQLIQIKNYPWYKKIYQKILKILGIKKD